MAIFVTGLTGAAAEENDITMDFISGSTSLVFSGNNDMDAEWSIRINENITDLSYMFNNQKGLSGRILLNCLPTSYVYCFYYTAYESGKTIYVDYTSLCTNIDDIVATKTAKVYKGSLVVV